MTESSGLISFVGAGPGAPDLITLRGAERLSRADVVVWASSLVPQSLLAHTSPAAVIHDSAAMTLEDVLAVFEAERTSRIVRLHSGDPSIYGALQEQIDWCVSRSRDFEIVPGVSSLGAAAAAVGHELTVPGISQSVVVTRLPGRTNASMPERESMAAFSSIGATTAVFLSGARGEELQAELLRAPSAFSETTPAIVVVRASWPDEQVIRTTVGCLAAAIASSGASRTLLVLVGEALSGMTPSRSHLYSPTYAHAFRRRSLPGSTRGRPARRGRAEWR